MDGVKLSKVRKHYDDHPVIHGVDLGVREGEFMVFVGPSGCGKSTLLRMVAGLEDITDGEIEIGGECVNDVPPSDRGVAMVFQSYALYPHMTVEENMGFALRLAGKSKAEVQADVRRAAEILRVTDLLDRKPKALSGGQRQRVAIGRAIVRKPKVFLFDEPLSNLDASLRVQMRLELSRLHKELRTTMIYVTHDQVEAMTLGERIAVFNKGRIEQVGTPLELYERPVNQFVAGFLGSPKMNFIACMPSEQGGVTQLLFDDGTTLTLPWQPGRELTGRTLMGIRPEHLEMSPGSPGLPGRIELLEHLGDMVIAYVLVPGAEQPVAVKTTVAVGNRLRTGDTVSLQPQLAHAVLFTPQGLACSAP
jgi:multiple sugar transport system ATP-binding protein